MRVTFCNTSLTFDPWDFRNPDDPGIGGSETAVVECARRLALRGHEVTVYGTLREDTPSEWQGTRWLPLSEADYSLPGWWFLSRCPETLDNFSVDHPGQMICLTAQDVYYPQLTDERWEKLDRFIALCPTHVRFTKDKYPKYAHKVFGGFNGIRNDVIREIESVNPPVRNPRKIIFASSPDRGLLPLLKIFRRARQRVHDLELVVAYGFDNIEKIIASNPPTNHWRTIYDEAMREMRQPGVTWMGRIGQRQLIREKLSCGMSVHPTLFTETGPVHGDTRIETLQGPVRIKDLVGRQCRVYSCGPDGKLSISTVRDVSCKRRNAPVIKLTAISGRGCMANRESTLTLTPEHEVMLVDGSYVSAGSLRIGDHVKAFSRVVNGWGDGYDTIALTGEKMRAEHQFVASVSRGLDIHPGEVVDHVDGNKRNNEDWNLEIKTQAQHASEHWHRSPREKAMAHVKRMAAASKEGVSRERRQQIANSRWEKFRTLPPEVRDRQLAHLHTDEHRERCRASTKSRMDAKFGSQPWRDESALRREYVDMGRSSTDIANEWGATSTTVLKWLGNFGIPRRVGNSVGEKRGGNHVITKVEDAGLADVYCMESDPDHNFIADGIVVHNCISALEEMACGAIPILSPTWAAGDYCKHGVWIFGDPDDALTQARYVGEIFRLARQPELQEHIRAEMMPRARNAFNWERYVDLVESWMYGLEGHRNSFFQFNFALKHAKGAGRILNVGCCDDAGEMSKIGAVNVDKFEFDDHLKTRNAADIISDARDLPRPFQSHSFDMVCSTDMLEHFPTDEVPEQLEKFKACLKPGGRILFTVPNDTRNPNPDDTNVRGYGGHHHCPPEVIDRWLRDARLRAVVRQPIEYGFDDICGEGVVAVDDSPKHVERASDQEV